MKSLYILFASLISLTSLLFSNFNFYPVKATQTWLDFNDAAQTVTITDLFNSKETHTVHYTRTDDKIFIRSSDLPTGVSAYTITIHDHATSISEQSTSGISRTQTAYATTDSIYSTDAQ
ncbi:hypothetical protein ACFQ5M_02220 [Agrilactobacillus yilanensis]|uniref:Uncharacterized protein n=1 Tax=Agrilactobacillus yilanensis TaxID=2485997 RepID=A0ABW4J5I3_9LACO|nr:hypothetical protein [Agrilactobacillus yilanensis]